MPRMFKQSGGYINVSDEEAVSLGADGWVVITDSMWKDIIEAKRKNSPDGMPSFLVADTIAPQIARRPGRPRKMLSTDSETTQE